MRTAGSLWCASTVPGVGTILTREVVVYPCTQSLVFSSRERADRTAGTTILDGFWSTSAPSLSCIGAVKGSSIGVEDCDIWLVVREVLMGGGVSIFITKPGLEATTLDEV